MTSQTHSSDKMAAMVVLLLGLAIELAVLILPIQGQSLSSETKIRSPYTTSRGIELLYGSYESGSLAWAPRRTKTFPNSWPKTVTVYVLTDIAYIEADKAQHLLITYAVPQSENAEDVSCHSCQVLMGFACFIETGETWQLEAKDLQFGMYGEFGRPPAVSLQPLGPNRYGVQLLDGSGGQGWIWNDLTIIMPVQHGFKTVFSSRTLSTCGMDLNGRRARNCEDFDSALSLIPNIRNKDYYDLVMTKRSYAPAANTVNNRSSRYARKVYSFDGDKFVKQK